MPLIYDEGGLLLWRVTESEEELAALVAECDRASAARFNSAARRREHLAWRAALRTALPGADIEYNEVGAPIVSNFDDGVVSEAVAETEKGASRDSGSGHNIIYISVSHTEGLAAVAISERPCGVDVERLGRDVERMRARFVRADEERLADAGRDDFAVGVWCAKEVIYKMSGRRELDFLKDLRIAESDLANGTIGGMSVLRTGEWIVVFKL